MEYEPIIREIIEKKFNDGSFEKMLNEYVDKAMNSLLQDLFKHSNWGSEKDGECYTIIKDAVSPILVTALGKSDLNELAQKTLLVLNQLILESSLHQFSKNAGAALELFKNNEFEYGKTISLRDMLKRYKQEVEGYYGFDKEWFDEHDYDTCEGSADLDISVDVIEDDDEYHYSRYDHKKLIFKVSDLDEDESEYQDTLFIVPIYKSYNGKWQIDSASLQLKLADLKHSQEFIVYCSLIAMNGMEITDLQFTSDTAEFRDLYQ